MKKAVWLFVILLPLLIFCAATPGPVFRMQMIPDENDRVWLYGKEYARIAGDNLEFIIAFDRVLEAENLVSFDVEIVNQGTQTVLVTPESFKGYYLLKNKEATVSSPYTAVDPELKLLVTDLALSRENSRYLQENGLKGVARIFDLVYDLATITQEKTEEELADEEQEDIDREEGDIQDENHHNAVMTDFWEKRDVWENTALRKSTLPPGFSMEGKIFFPMRGNCLYLKIVFDEEHENLETVFQILKYKSQTAVYTFK